MLSVIIELKKILLLFNIISILFVIVLVNCETKYLSENLDVGNVVLSKLRPKSKDCGIFCSSITCETIKECKNGAILKNESYCNCCDACVEYIHIDKTCNNVIKGSLALGSQARCMPGTRCINGICTIDPDFNGCLQLRDIRQKLKGVGNYSENIWIPQCDNEGNYMARQRKTEKTICVDEWGNRIFGSPEDSLKNSCSCSRHMLKESEKDSIVYKPQEHCTSSGSFDKLQCINNLCYCADPDTGHVNSSLVRINFLDKLHCYDKKFHQQSYLKDCEIQLQRTRKIRNELKQKNIKLDSIDIVKCDPDGSFAPVQREKNQFICTDKEGKNIGSYAKDIEEDVSIKTTCNCAREISRDFNSGITCSGDGSFRNARCDKDECFCLDQDGSRISKGIAKSEENINLICKKLIEDSLKYRNNADDELDNNDNDTDDYKDGDYR